MKRITKSLPFKLLLGVCIGIIVGLLAGEGLMNIIVTVKYILGQYINFCVPLIVIGFIAPSIPKLGNNASKMLAVALVIAYVSSLGAAVFSVLTGNVIIPYLSIASSVGDLKVLPEVVFKLDIPQIMGVMSALVFSLLVGLAATWTRAVTDGLSRSLKSFEVLEQGTINDYTNNSRYNYYTKQLSDNYLCSLVVV